MPTIPSIQFENVISSSGIHAELHCGSPQKNWIPEANGTGVAWLDYDNDGLQDLLIVNGADMPRLRQILAHAALPPAPHSLYLFHNLGGGKFKDVTEAAGLTNAYWGTGVNAADYNNDGFIDILITNIGVDLLYRNNGNGTFSEIGQAAGLSRDIAWHTGSGFADFDGDGFLDLFVAGYVDLQAQSWEDPPPRCKYRGVEGFCGPIGLKGQRGIYYHNRGDGTFINATTTAGLANVRQAHSFSVLADDLNNDGWPDLFVANDSDANFLFLNTGHGTFRDAALEQGVAYSADGNVQANMGIAAANPDVHGNTSLLTTTFSEDRFAFFQRGKDGLYGEVAAEAGLDGITRPLLGWACGFADFDNDERQELWLANGHVYPKRPDYWQPLVILADAGNKFVRREQYPATPNNSYRGAAVGDFDNDGRLDLVVLPVDGEPLLLHNTTDAAGAWLDLQLIGTHSNRDAIGASVQIFYCGKMQRANITNGGSYLSRNDGRIHFGLGACSTVDHVEVQWPRGTRQIVAGTGTRKLLQITEQH